MMPVSSSSGGTYEGVRALLVEGGAIPPRAPGREASTGSLGDAGAMRMLWQLNNDLGPFPETDDPSVWGGSPAPVGVGGPSVVEVKVSHPPMIDSALTVRRVNQARDRCFNRTISLISGGTAAAGSYAIFEIYEKTEVELKVLGFVPLCLLVVIAFGVSVYRGYLGCCRRS